MRALQERAEHERAELVARAAAEQAVILQRVSHTEDERRRLEIEMDRKAAEHERAMREKEALQEMLQGMQEKLLVGGQVLDRAAKQVLCCPTPMFT